MLGFKTLSALQNIIIQHKIDLSPNVVHTVNYRKEIAFFIYRYLYFYLQFQIMVIKKIRNKKAEERCVNILEYLDNFISDASADNGAVIPISFFSLAAEYFF